MAREILFRGKRIDNGEWVEGYYVYLEAEKMWSHRIYTGYAEVDVCDFYPDFFEVSYDTIAQYTGLTDKNGRKIFEGDIVFKRTYHGKKRFPVTFSGGMFHCGYGGGDSTATHPYTLDDKKIEVVGNIYDNKELLEGESDE